MMTSEKTSRWVSAFGEVWDRRTRRARPVVWGLNSATSLNRLFVIWSASPNRRVHWRLTNPPPCRGEGIYEARTRFRNPRQAACFFLSGCLPTHPTAENRFTNYFNWFGELTKRNFGVSLPLSYFLKKVTLTVWLRLRTKVTRFATKTRIFTNE